MSDTLAQPLDVKLMNITASALMLGFAVLVLAALASWATRATVFSIGAITVTGDVSHSNALTLRANVAPQLEGTFFTIDLAQARQAFERAPWCAGIFRTGSRWCCRNTRLWRTGDPRLNRIC